MRTSKKPKNLNIYVTYCTSPALTLVLQIPMFRLTGSHKDSAIPRATQLVFLSGADPDGP